MKEMRWMRDSQSAAKEAYDSGASDYQGYQFFDQSNPRTSIKQKGFTMLAPGRSNLTSSVKNVDGTRTYGVASAFTQPQPGGASRVIS